MRKRTSSTILQRAIITIPDFEKVLTQLSQQVTLRGPIQSTLNNSLALFIIHFEKIPKEINPTL